MLHYIPSGTKSGQGSEFGTIQCAERPPNFPVTSCQNSEVSRKIGTDGHHRFSVNLYNKRRYVCLFVCLYLCSIWPAKRLGRSRPNLTHALMSTRGVFPSRSMSRSFMYACGSDRITKHPERCAKATPGERLRNSVRTTGNYS